MKLHNRRAARVGMTMHNELDNTTEYVLRHCIDSLRSQCICFSVEVLQDAAAICDMLQSPMTGSRTLNSHPELLVC